MHSSEMSSGWQAQPEPVGGAGTRGCTNLTFCIIFFSLLLEKEPKAFCLVSHPHSQLEIYNHQGNRHLGVSMRVFSRKV